METLKKISATILVSGIFLVSFWLLYNILMRVPHGLFVFSIMAIVILTLWYDYYIKK